MDTPTPREPFRASGTSANRPTRWKAAGMVNRTPDGSNRHRMQGRTSRRRPEDQVEALIQDLKVREKSLNGIFLSVREPFIIHLTFARLVVKPTRVDDPFLFARRLA
jgi:hypothetical protein